MSPHLKGNAGLVLEHQIIDRLILTSKAQPCVAFAGKSGGAHGLLGEMVARAELLGSSVSSAASAAAAADGTRRRRRRCRGVATAAAACTWPAWRDIAAG